MAKTYNRLELDVNKKFSGIITEVQGDSNSRYLDVSLFSNGVPLDLTGHEVKIFMEKPENGGEIWNDGVITDATAGRCEFLMTTEALSKMGHLQTQISVWKDNTEILSTQVFEIYVTKTLLGNSSVESSNEYGTLVLLFQNLYEAHDLMVDMVSSFGKKGTVAEARDIATFWQGVEYLAKYMDTDLKGLIEKAIANSSVQGVLDLIGSAGDSGDATIFGKLNKPNAIESTLDYTVAGIDKSGTIIKLNGQGRIYQLATIIGNTAGASNIIQFIVDGQILYTITMKNSTNSYMGIMAINQPVYSSEDMFLCNPATKNNINCVCNGYITSKTVTVNWSSYNSAVFMIYVPEYIAFQKSFEIKVTLGVTSDTSNNYSMIGYKMM